MNDKISKYLKYKRKQIGISQREMASRLGIKVQNYQRYELGTRNPKFDMLLKITKVYGITISQFIDEFENYKGECENV